MTDINWGGILGNAASNIISEALPSGSASNMPPNSYPTTSTGAPVVITAPAVDHTKLYLMVGGGALMLVMVMVLALRK